ncbi:MAG: prolipoprotein diacylglyceryl transferase, partial [Ruthenibacterium sp.]
MVFALKKSRSFGVNDDRLIDVIFLSTLCAIVGARAYYVMFAPFQYNSFAEMIDIRDGGVAIYGAVIAAFLSGWLFCRLRKIPVLPAFDLTAMGFLLGQGIGRWGNFFNQEAFGTNTSLPWGMYSESTNSYLAGMQQKLLESGVAVNPALPVHPTFLYESLWCLLGFFLLWAYSRHRRFNGEILLLYFIWYGVERAFVEGLRTDSLDTVFGLRVSQVLAVVSALAALVIWLVLRKKYQEKPLMVTYDFTVFPGQKASPLVTMTWRASDPMPTQDAIALAWRQTKPLPVGVWHWAKETTNHG